MPTPLRTSRSSTKRPASVPSTTMPAPHVALKAPEYVEAVSWETDHCRSVQVSCVGTEAELELHSPTSSDANADGALGFRPPSLLISQPANRIVVRQAEHVISFLPSCATGTEMFGAMRFTPHGGANSGPVRSRDVGVEDSLKVVAQTLPCTWKSQFRPGKVRFREPRGVQ